MSSHQKETSINPDDFLAEAIFQTDQRLSEFSESERFALVLETAFGTDLNLEAVQDLREDLQNGNYLNQFAIALVSSSEIMPLPRIQFICRRRF
jgi:protein involved in sex pheromone biosynthesis